MQSLQAHAPQMKEIQKKYKGDRQKMNEELMKFYRENNINPAASCLPLLAQFPVFISLFYVLRQFAKHPPGGDLSWLGVVPSIAIPVLDHWSGYLLLFIYAVLAFQLHGRGGMVPQHAEIAAELQQPFFLSSAQRLGLLSEREDARLEIRHLFERLIPPSLEFARHEAVLGIGRIKLPLRPSRLIPGLLQRQFNGLTFRLVLVKRLLQCVQGRLQTGGLDRVEYLVDHGLVHTHTPD